MRDANGEPVRWLDILEDRELSMGEFVVLYHNGYFPNEYPAWYLIYLRGSVISRGDLLPITYASRMVRTGRTFDPERYNGQITVPPQEEVS